MIRHTLAADASRTAKPTSTSSSVGSAARCLVAILIALGLLAVPGCTSNWGGVSGPRAPATQDRWWVAALASTLLDEGKAVEAVDALERHLVRDPSDPEAHSLLSTAHHAAGNFEQALVHSQVAYDLEPASRRYFYNLAVCRLASGRVDLAAELIEHARDQGMLPLHVLGLLEGEVRAMERRE